MGVCCIILGESFLKKKWHFHFQSQSGRNIITALINSEQSWEDGNSMMFAFKSVFDTLKIQLSSLWMEQQLTQRLQRHKRNRHLCRAFTLILYNHGMIKITGERPSKCNGRPSRLQFKMTKLLFLFLLE